MQRYKRLYTEEDTNNNGVPDWYDKKVSTYIKMLRDENFGSEDQRKKMLDILTSLHNSLDKRSRLLFKKIGEHLTEIGNEILKYGLNKEEKMKRYKRKFEEADDSILDQIIATIDLSPLENEVKKRIGIGVVFSIEKQRGSRTNYLSVTSKDLTKYTGIFKNIYKYCVLKTSNSSINDEEPTWWMTLGFGYEYKSGGSNGTELLTSWYNYETKQWTFR